MAYYRVNLNTVRNGLPDAPEERRIAEARRFVKIRVARRAASGPFTDSDVPDFLANDDAVRRFLK